jgi:hypothetical protein
MQIQVPNLSLATHNTYNYLVFLKTKISKILDNDGDMLDDSHLSSCPIAFAKAGISQSLAIFSIVTDLAISCFR